MLFAGTMRYFLLAGKREVNSGRLHI